MARHELTASGRRFRLRPLNLEDAAFVVRLRTDPNLSRYIHPTSPSEADQRAWTEAYFLRSDEYLFVVEDAVNGEQEGTVSLYHVDPATRQAEMGRWVLRSGSLAAPESALLAYQLAFEVFAVRRVYCLTVRDNKQVVSFHRSCGLTEGGPVEPVELNGVRHEMVEQFVSDETWPNVALRLDQSAHAVARLLSR